MQSTYELRHFDRAQLQEYIGYGVWPIDNPLCVITQREPLVNAFSIPIVGTSKANDLQLT